MAKVVSIINGFPRPTGEKAKWGWYKVVATYWNGEQIQKTYYAFGRLGAKYQFLVEHGSVRGSVDVYSVEEEK